VVARDNDDARLGKDVLQLVDQIGFLRTIHANSNIRSKRASAEVQQNSSRLPATRSEVRGELDPWRRIDRNARGSA
jgi:hypothetical protein